MDKTETLKEGPLGSAADAIDYALTDAFINAMNEHGELLGKPPLNEAERGVIGDLMVRAVGEALNLPIQDELRAENERLREALKPFARLAANLAPNMPDDACHFVSGLTGDYFIVASQLRRAAEALKGQTP